MSYYLIQGEKHFQQNQTIKTEPNKPYYGSINKSIKGRWYFEFTHFSGTGHHICGFNFDVNSEFSFSGNGNNAKIYFLRNTKNDYTSGETKDIPFSISSEHTLGISIDVEQKLFTIYYNSLTFSVHYTLTLSVSKLNVHFREITSSGCEDRISVNLGDHKFVSGVPYGYTAWSKIPIILTCKHYWSTSFLISKCIFVIFILLDK